MVGTSPIEPLARAESNFSFNSATVRIISISVIDNLSEATDKIGVAKFKVQNYTLFRYGANISLLKYIRSKSHNYYYVK